MLSRRTLVVALIAFLAAIAGAFVGRAPLPARPVPHSELHELLHHGLKLDNAQKARLAMLEDQFATNRKALELELRADNAKLGTSINRVIMQADCGFAVARVRRG